MKTTLVLTVIARDEPGIVKAVAEAVAAHGGNWEASRMARLGGQFAGLVCVDVDTDRAEALMADLAALEARGLRLVIADTVRPPVAPQSRVVALDLIGNDHPGIVRAISAALAELSVNVEELETACVEAPMDGGMLFKASARLTVPASVSTRELQRHLEALASDLMVDVKVEGD
jgi:glycine cleavage system regulatory protein